MLEKTEIQNGFRQRTTYYRWNASNQLIGITTNRGEVWYYKYDGLGRRIAKECPQHDLKIEFVWDGDQLAYTQTFKNDELQSRRHCIFNGWQLLAQQDWYSELEQNHNGNVIHHRAETSYAITQPNGKVLALFNPQGRKVWSEEPKSIWGLRLNALFRYAKPSPLSPQMLFAGQWLDEESGLAYNRFRYYDPTTANYLCSDPIGLNGGSLPYFYVQNPWDWIDPFGLASCHGLPSTRKAGGTGKNYDPVNGQGLYVLRDPVTNQIKYVGRGDAHARGVSHQHSLDKRHLVQEVLFNNNLTKAEAKYLEQRLIDYLGGAKSTNPATNLMNKIRSYSLSNPNSNIYSIAGDSSSWGNAIFNDLLKKL